jgi:hypothetical protein
VKLIFLQKKARKLNKNTQYPNKKPERFAITNRKRAVNHGEKPRKSERACGNLLLFFALSSFLSLSLSREGGLEHFFPILTAPLD